VQLTPIHVGIDRYPDEIIWHCYELSNEITQASVNHSPLIGSEQHTQMRREIEDNLIDIISDDLPESDKSKESHPVTVPVSGHYTLRFGSAS
jgi:hypothetical protein